MLTENMNRDMTQRKILLDGSVSPKNKIDNLILIRLHIPYNKFDVKAIHHLMRKVRNIESTRTYNI